VLVSERSQMTWTSPRQIMRTKPTKVIRELKACMSYPRRKDAAANRSIVHMQKSINTSEEMIKRPLLCSRLDTSHVALRVVSAPLHDRMNHSLRQRACRNGERDLYDRTMVESNCFCPNLDLVITRRQENQ
jgi:hypothetical protein